MGLALEQATQDLDPERKAVLFVIAFKNYNGFEGFRFNSEATCSYPGEQRIVLKEGAHIQVLGVEVDEHIDNKHTNFKDFNDHAITIIHLFHN